MTKRLESKGVSVWGHKKLGGYAGLKHTASKIIDYIPKCKVYCEPLAGLGRVASLGIDCEEIVLNDKSDYALKYLRQNFPDDTVRSFDFMKCIELYDDDDTFFLIDPPWMHEIYNGNSLSFCDRKDKEYYEQIMKVLPNLKADWILVCGIHPRYRGSTIMRKSSYNLLRLESDNKPIFGKKASVLLASNKPFIKKVKSQ